MQTYCNVLKYWHECHELLAGGGVRQEQNPWILEWSLSTETAQLETETRNFYKDETPEISVNIQDDSDDDDSRSVSPAPSVSSNTCCSEGGAKSSRKRAQKSTKPFVDNKREKVQKKLTQEGKQRQLEPQQAMMEGLTRKDDGLALLNKTLATGLQFMFSAMKPPGKIGYQSSNPPGFTANNWFNQLQFPPFYSDTHMSATREHTEQHNFDFDGYTHGKYNE